MSNRRVISISVEIYEALKRRGNFGDSFSSVLAKILEKEFQYRNNEGKRSEIVESKDLDGKYFTKWLNNKLSLLTELESRNSKMIGEAKRADRITIEEMVTKTMQNILKYFNARFYQKFDLELKGPIKEDKDPFTAAEELNTDRKEGNASPSWAEGESRTISINPDKG